MTLSNKRSTSTSVAAREPLRCFPFLHVWLTANTCDLSPTAEMPAAFLRPPFCSVLCTLSRAKDSSQAAPSRLVLLRQSLKNTQTWPVLVWCPGYCDRHVSLFPYRPEHRKRSELLHHLRFVAGARRGLLLAFGLFFYDRQKCRQCCSDLCKEESWVFFNNLDCF